MQALKVWICTGAFCLITGIYYVQYVYENCHIFDILENTEVFRVFVYLAIASLIKIIECVTFLNVRVDTKHMAHMLEYLCGSLIAAQYPSFKRRLRQVHWTLSGELLYLTSTTLRVPSRPQCLKATMLIIIGTAMNVRNLLVELSDPIASTSLFYVPLSELSGFVWLGIEILRILDPRREAPPKTLLKWGLIYDSITIYKYGWLLSDVWSEEGYLWICYIVVVLLRVADYWTTHKSREPGVVTVKFT